MRNKKRRLRGFTLIELMIALAIIALLAAIAMPSYKAYIVRSNRAAAEVVLMDIAQRQQQYLLDNRAYAPDTATLGVSVPSKVTSVYNIPAFTIAAGPPPTFTVSAVPITGNTQDGDGTLSIDQAGVKSPASKW
jgi:type IV pilus assembly protein PilE